MAKRLIDHTYDFHMAVQAIERDNPDAIPLGEGYDPEQEAVILKAHVSDAIPDHEIHSIEADRHRPVMWMNLISLGGRGGPLPEVYTDMLKERIRRKDLGFRDFLDVFNHRLASLWYRFRKKMLIGFVQKPSHETTVGEVGICLSGISNKKLIQNTTLDPAFLISSQTLLWARHRSLAGLTTILQDYFGYKIKVEPWQGGWNEVSERDVTRLGGPWNELGKNTILGSRSWNMTQGIRIHVYKVNAQKAFPFQIWKDIVRLYLGMRLKVYIRLHFVSETIKFVNLKKESVFRLGINTWLSCDPKDTMQCSYEFFVDQN